MGSIWVTPGPDLHLVLDLIDPVRGAPFAARLEAGVSGIGEVTADP